MSNGEQLWYEGSTDIGQELLNMAQEAAPKTDSNTDVYGGQKRIEQMIFEMSNKGSTVTSDLTSNYWSYAKTNGILDEPPGSKQIETTNGNSFTLTTSQPQLEEPVTFELPRDENPAVTSLNQIFSTPELNSYNMQTTTVENNNNSLNLNPPPQNENIPEVYTQFVVEYNNGIPTIMPAMATPQPPPLIQNNTNTTLYNGTSSGVNTTLYNGTSSGANTTLYNGISSGANTTLYNGTSSGALSMPSLDSLFQDKDENNNTSVAKKEDPTLDFLQGGKFFMDEKKTLEQQLAEQKQICANLGNDYNEKLTLAKSQMDTWLKMWTDAEATLKEENAKQSKEIAELKAALESSEGELGDLRQIENGEKKVVINMPINNPYGENLNQKYKELHELLQKKMAEISQLKLVNDRYAKDSDRLCQKPKGHAEPKSINSSKLEMQLKDAITAKETSKLELMVMKERNKIQEVKIKELHAVVQKQEFKISVMSSQMNEYRNIKNSKIKSRSMHGNSVIDLE